MPPHQTQEVEDELERLESEQDNNDYVTIATKPIQSNLIDSSPSLTQVASCSTASGHLQTVGVSATQPPQHQRTLRPHSVLHISSIQPPTSPHSSSLADSRASPSADFSDASDAGGRISSAGDSSTHYPQLPLLTRHFSLPASYGHLSWLLPSEHRDAGVQTQLPFDARATAKHTSRDLNSPPASATLTPQSSDPQPPDEAQQQPQPEPEPEPEPEPVDSAVEAGSEKWRVSRGS